MKVYRPHQVALVAPRTHAVQEGHRVVPLAFSETFDDVTAEEVLNLSINDMVGTAGDAIMKSMYEFDLDSYEGVIRLLSLLPILDPDIVKTVVQEIWPGYPVDSEIYDNSVAKAEIRGYLLDFLEGHGTEIEDIDSTDEDQPDGGAEFPDGADDGSGPAPPED